MKSSLLFLTSECPTFRFIVHCSLHVLSCWKGRRTFSFNRIACKLRRKRREGNKENACLFFPSYTWVLFRALSFLMSEKAMATHSGVLAWRIPGTGEPGGLLSMGSHSRSEHNIVNKLDFNKINFFKRTFWLLRFFFVCAPLIFCPWGKCLSLPHLGLGLALW